MDEITVGGLCSGTGILEHTIADQVGGRVAWHAQHEPADKNGKPDRWQFAARILQHHWPHIPNLGDITKIDWDQVEPVHIMVAGYPCQPFSPAGLRHGEEDTRHIWPWIANGIATLKPAMVFLENVAGHLTLGFETVLRDLHWLGYDVHWIVINASDVDAPHKRARIFILGVLREQRLRCRSDRRGGDDRHRPHDRRHVCDPRRCRHDRCGDPDPQGPAADVRWAAQPHEAGGRESSAEAALVPGGRGSSRLPDEDRIVSDPEAGPGRFGAGTPGTDLQVAEGSRPQILEPSAPARSGDPQATDQRAEPARRTPRRSSRARRADTGGRVPLGSLVGVRGRAVGADSVLRPAACLGLDESGPGLCCHAALDCLAASTLADAADDGYERGGNAWGRRDGPEDSDHPAVDSNDAQPRRQQGEQPGGTAPARSGGGHIDWGPYTPAIRRWEEAFGRPAPRPTQPGRNGPQLAPVFSEWMMGLPECHVTGVPKPEGMTAAGYRNHQLKVIGGGVVPQQARYAWQVLMQRARREVGR